MGLFSRLATLIKSNINDVISRSEDPEKMLNQIVLDMQTQLVEAKQQVAASIADEKRLQKQAEQELAASVDWERKAMMAVRAGNEELAKEGLLRKKEHDSMALTYQTEWQKQKTQVEQLKRALRMLNDKIEEAKRKKNVLIARKKRAEAQKSIQETMHGLKDHSAFETFDRMAQKIDQIEAEAEAQEEVQEEYTGDILASKFASLEKKSDAEGDLLALKRKMGLAPPEEEKPEPPKARVEGAAPTAPAVPASEADDLAQALEELEREHEEEKKRAAK